MALRRSALVAAMTRTSTGMRRVPPTRSISRSWSTRRILAWRSTRRVAISSRNSVPAVRQLELPELPRDGAREGALLVAEELRLEERLGDRGDVHRDERLVAPRPVPVDRPRDELLPRPALPRDQHGERVPRDRADQLVELLHQRVLADQLVEVALPRQLRPEVDHLAVEGAPLERAADQGQDLVLVERLGHVVERAELHGGHRGADGLDGGHQDHLDVLVDRLDPLQDLDAVHARQPHVQEDEVHRASPGRARGPARPSAASTRSYSSSRTSRNASRMPGSSSTTRMTGRAGAIRSRTGAGTSLVSVRPRRRRDPARRARTAWASGGGRWSA